MLYWLPVKCRSVVRPSVLAFPRLDLSIELSLLVSENLGEERIVGTHMKRYMMASMGRM